jgi:hypothetical protein
MNNLEKQCLEKLNEILSKFYLAINIVNIPNIECQYRLVDNSLFKTPYSEWLGLWLSVSNILLHRNSIFECLKLYHDCITDKYFEFHMSSMEINFYQRYSEVYQFIQPLKSNCLEEFLIRCDLIGI